MTNKEIFALVGKILTIDEHPGLKDEMEQMISNDCIEWQKLVALCSEHLILPSIYLKFKNNYLIDLLPLELAEFLKEIYDLNFSRNERILNQLRDLTVLLNRHDIFPVFLKGTGNLLDQLYCDKGERMIGDIDLLVPEKDYLSTAKILENDGYFTDGKFIGDLEAIKHYPRLAKIGVEVNVEIHRQLVTPSHSKMFNPGTIKKTQKQVAKDASCFVLSDNDKAIHNFIHCQLDHQGHIYASISFRDLYDLYLIAKRVNLKELIPLIQEKKKAITYFVFAGKAFNSPSIFYLETPSFTKIFLLKHRLNLDSKVFYKSFRVVRYLGRTTQGVVSSSQLE
jgi:hypothetical protein